MIPIPVSLERDQEPVKTTKDILGQFIMSHLGILHELLVASEQTKPDDTDIISLTIGTTTHMISLVQPGIKNTATLNLLLPPITSRRVLQYIHYNLSNAI